ncbi:MAG: acyl carrier protein [Acidimicrobiia bacterium]
MNKADMEQAIIRYVNDHIVGGGGTSVAADDEIVLDGTIDSLGVTRLIDFLEKDFAITIPAEDVTIDNFRSISAMVDYVLSRRSAGGAS